MMNLHWMLVRTPFGDLIGAYLTDYDICKIKATDKTVNDFCNRWITERNTLEVNKFNKQCDYYKKRTNRETYNESLDEEFFKTYLELFNDDADYNKIANRLEILYQKGAGTSFFKEYSGYREIKNNLSDFLCFIFQDKSFFIKDFDKIFKCLKIIIDSGNAIATNKCYYSHDATYCITICTEIIYTIETYPSEYQTKILKNVLELFDYICVAYKCSSYDITKHGLLAKILIMINDNKTCRG